MQYFYSIGPKIGTSVAPPSMKSTEHGLKITVKLSQALTSKTVCIYNTYISRAFAVKFLEEVGGQHFHR